MALYRPHLFPPLRHNPLLECSQMLKRRQVRGVSDIVTAAWFFLANAPFCGMIRVAERASPPPGAAS